MTRRWTIPTAVPLLGWIILIAIGIKGTLPDTRAPPVLGEVSPGLLLQKEGQTVEMLCEARASPAPNLVWYKEGRELAATDRVTIAGSRVQITALGRNDGGVYSCVFKNIVGSVSHIIKLVIQGDGWISSGNVFITVPPKNLTVVESSSVRMMCQAEGYPDNITYTWFRNAIEVRLIPSLFVRGIELGDGTLVIRNVAKDDTGWYRCRASNNLGTPPEADAYLNVTYLPRVISMPERLYLGRSMFGRLDCLVEANPPLTVIIWSKNNVMIDYVGNRHVKTDKYGSLLFNPVKSADEGQYTCTPYSPLGVGHTSTPVQVFVRDPPFFVDRPQPVYQRQPNQSVTFPCSADGDPKPTLTWRKADGEFPISTKLLYGGGNLTIVSLDRVDQGIYECVAANVVASIVTTTLLIIELANSHAPSNVTIETTWHSAKLSWLPAFDGGFLQHYVIWYRLLNHRVDNWKTLRVLPPDSSTLTVHQLQPDAVYEFMVLSRNRLGVEQFSSIVTARTKGLNLTRTSTQDNYTSAMSIGKDDDEDELDASGSDTTIRPDPPLNLTVQQYRSSVLICWQVPQSSPLKIHHYIVQYRTVGQWVPLTSHLPPDQTSHNWTTASRGATYHFRVLSYSLVPTSFDNSWSTAGDYVPAEFVSSLPSPTVTIQTGDPMSDGSRTSNALLGIALVGLVSIIFVVALTILGAKIFRKWKRRQKSTQSGQILDSTVDMEVGPAVFDNHVIVPHDSKQANAKETAI